MDTIHTFNERRNILYGESVLETHCTEQATCLGKASTEKRRVLNMAGIEQGRFLNFPGTNQGRFFDMASTEQGRFIDMASTEKERFLNMADIQKGRFLEWLASAEKRWFLNTPLRVEKVPLRHCKYREGKSMTSIEQTRYHQYSVGNVLRYGQYRVGKVLSFGQ